MVPSARLELAQLSPLPPQDSVSTNFTTTAALKCCTLHEEPKLVSSVNTPKFYPEITPVLTNYFAGICDAPLAGASGTAVPGVTAAGVPLLSRTLPLLGVRKFPK